MWFVGHWAVRFDDVPKSVAEYYQQQSSPQLETLLTMRERILQVIPDAVEVMKYGMPTFMINDVAIAGIMAHKNHVGYYPYSGSVLAQFPELLEKYSSTKSALHVPIDRPLAKSVIKQLLQARLAQPN